MKDCGYGTPFLGYLVLIMISMYSLDLHYFIKNMLPSYTVKNVPAERCPMKALMLDAFKEKLEDLNFAPNKRHALIDFISTLSVMATKACTVKNI